MPGPFYLAWVDADEAFNPSIHFREDEDILSFVLSQTEGNFATLDIDIQNPRVGLLSIVRKRYAYFSVDNGTGPELQFFGCVIGSPSSINGPLVTLRFIARPVDYDVRKHHYAQGLKVTPNYDPIFLDLQHRDDPDAILEGYSALYHTDRRDHTVTVSDVLTGEDGTEVFTEDEILKDTIDVTYGEVPLRSISMDASVTWAQASTGTLALVSGTLKTVSGDQFIGSFPKPGADLGGGWSVAYSSCVDRSGTAQAQMFTHNYNWNNTEKKHIVGDTMSVQTNISIPLGPTFLAVELTRAAQIGVIDPDPDIKDVQPAFLRTTTQYYMGPYLIDYSLVAKYQAGTDRSEHVTFTLSADLQEIITIAHPGASGPSEIITIQGADVALPVQQTDWITKTASVIEGPPIIDPQRNVFFTTPRGLQALEYLICVARARLAYRSRGVNLKAQCSPARAFALSCRKNATVPYSKLPGGTATGKIISYSISGTGGQPSGTPPQIIGEFTIGCCIGKGGHASTAAGVGVYAQPGYMQSGYQQMSGQTNALGIGDVAYTIPTTATNAAGMTFPLTLDQVLLGITWHNSYDSEVSLATGQSIDNLRRAVTGLTGTNPSIDAQTLAARRANLSDASTIPEDSAQWVEIRLKALDKQNFGVTFPVDLTLLSLPRGIDLEAHA